MKSNPAYRQFARCLLIAAAALALAPRAAPAQIWNRIQKHMGEAQNVKNAMAPLTIAQEIDVGREVAAKLIGFYHLYPNEEVTRYVNLVGQTVAAQSDRRDITYHFAVLDSDDINAFSAPGGYIFITLGALKLCQDESELAGVLAHEVGHVAAKHVLHIVERDNGLRAGMEQASAYTPGSQFLQNMSNAVLVKIIDQGLAPADEFQADQLGITYAYKAGYPADGLERFLTRLNQATNQGAHSFWTRTHPPVPERNARIQQWISSHHWNDAGRPRLAERYEQAVAVIKSKPQS
jgi:predicted Zn-dependent protease